ncbi:secreted RxLR effector peptide protein, putative [Phytophthora infestans T30-4]|uniref:Secreted RxLR effector peptide protein, putative n=1 Tax=Phytophthora infestans (strain T30-4) TaxID=403677 RepID=D0P331_PHYIT|nr:secreted RxLR effector peptide protein, putative [Phytophthora infestans T30-4]EEY58803.1 secreted RxLR effector peptide protein, putative [Phytophthora infestans T30-4]|eukprot:XP_002895294.1 secreted RxLR effector peptide protein, putative [Phytophthora infestans T30-4]
MRSILYVALVFVVLSESSVVAAFLKPDASQSQFPSKASTDFEVNRSLRVAGQQVVQSGRPNDGYGGIWKAVTHGTAKFVKTPDVDMKKLIELAKKAEKLKKLVKPSSS